MALTSNTKRSSIYVIVISAICFSVIFNSLDKVKTSYITDPETLIQKSFTKIEKPIYEPENLVEIEKDTILSNGFNVKVRNFTVMEKSEAFKIQETKEIYRRPFNAVIDIEFEGESIFKTVVDNSYLRNINNTQSLFLEHAWLYEDAIDSDTVTLALSCLELRAVERYNIYLQINKEGKLLKVTSDRKFS